MVYIEIEMRRREQEQGQVLHTKDQAKTRLHCPSLGPIDLKQPL